MRYSTKAENICRVI